MSKSVSGWLGLGTAAAALLPAFAHAHVGVGEVGGFAHGMSHPILGLDHVCAMVAVGLWSAQMGGRSTWAVPLAFVSVMVMGGALGVLGIGLPFIEPGIVLSVLMLGVLIAAAVRLPLWVSTCLVGVSAMFHGYAHGAEMPGSAGAMTYALGFMLTTAILHVIGILSGSGLQRFANRRWMTAAGASIALSGVYLAVA